MGPPNVNPFPIAPQQGQWQGCSQQNTGPGIGGPNLAGQRWTSTPNWPGASPAYSSAPPADMQSFMQWCTINNQLNKLPDMTLPQFYGEKDKFPEWWEMWHTMIHDQPMEDVRKLHYLRLALKGKARDVLKGVPATADQYEPALRVLQSRYADPVLVHDLIYSKLHRQHQAESMSQARTSYDAIHSIYRDLRAMHLLPQDRSAVLQLLTTFKGKIPYKIAHAWDQKVKRKQRKRRLRME